MRPFRGITLTLSLALGLTTAMRTEPTDRKAGFSGFLNFPNATCDDAKVLGLDDSWFYTWMPATSRGK